MLKLSIHSNDLSGPWRREQGHYVAGESRIEPFRNIAVEDYAFASELGFLLVVRERAAGLSLPVPSEGVPAVESARWQELLVDALRWPLQFVALLIQPGTFGNELTLLSGPWGVGPVHVVSCGDRLVGSWDPMDLYAHLEDRPLDPVRACHFLAFFDAPYSRRTMFRGLWTLTERSRAVWRRSTADARSMRFDVQYAPSILIPRPDRVRSEADVLDAFWNILKTSMARWLPPGFDGAGVELSGGLDSTIVAAAASDLLETPLLTSGVILLDDMGEAQRARRTELVHRFGLRDATVEMREWVPFAPGSTRLREGPVVPWEDVYFEALDELLRVAARRGVRLMFTGLGGDELCGGSDYDLSDEDLAAIRLAELAEEQVAPEIPAFLTAAGREYLVNTHASLDAAPQSLISSSGLSASACSSAMSMRHGIWTASPLCTPELVAFCARLPLEWREDRRIERRLLTRLGCSSNVTHPPQPDDFSPACRRGLRHEGRAGVTELFRESRLADLGLVDRDRLLATYRAWCEGDAATGDLPFYSAAILELALRSIERRSHGEVRDERR